ncbi:LysR substrate-binding domain-containing protein [Streptomyces diastaticus]|nr:LysR substrate-binding domain-containing protein [Streptomyces sp. ADI98-12]
MSGTRAPDRSHRVAALCPVRSLFRDEADLAVVLPPFREPRLELGPVLSRRPQYLATSQRHAFAGREALETEEPAGPPLVEVAAPAPDHWHAAQTPTRTPSGAPVSRGPPAGTLQEGLSLVAADRGVTSLCHPATRYGPRAPESALGLVWHGAR